MATVFVGGSALLLAGAMAALAFGFANGEEGLVWTALIASGVAALFLVIAYVLSLREVRASRRTTSAEPIPGVTAPPAKRREEPKPEEPAAPEASRPEGDGGEAQSEEPPSEAEQTSTEPTAPAALSAGSPTASKPSTGKKSSSPGTAAAAKPSSPSDTVVGVPARKKFHRPECRYAKTDSGEEMTRAAARKRGMSPCGICKP